jgi:hypothetical protein
MRLWDGMYFQTVDPNKFETLFWCPQMMHLTYYNARKCIYARQLSF